MMLRAKVGFCTRLNKELSKSQNGFGTLKSMIDSISKNRSDLLPFSSLCDQHVRMFSSAKHKDKGRKPSTKNTRMEKKHQREIIRKPRDLVQSGQIFPLVRRFLKNWDRQIRKRSARAPVVIPTAKDRWGVVSADSDRPPLRVSRMMGHGQINGTRPDKWDMLLSSRLIKLIPSLL